MACLKIPIRIDGLEIAINAIKGVLEEGEFKEDVSDDYKNGFYDFANAAINALEKLKDSDPNAE